MANSTKIAIVGLMILLVVVVAKYVKTGSPVSETPAEPVIAANGGNDSTSGSGNIELRASSTPPVVGLPPELRNPLIMPSSVGGKFVTIDEPNYSQDPVVSLDGPLVETESTAEGLVEPDVATAFDDPAPLDDGTVLAPPESNTLLEERLAAVRSPGGNTSDDVSTANIDSGPGTTGVPAARLYSANPPTKKTRGLPGFPKKHTIKEGESPWVLASLYYGGPKWGHLHPIISKANKGIKFHPGNIVTIPSPPPNTGRKAKKSTAVLTTKKSTAPAKRPAVLKRTRTSPARTSAPAFYTVKKNDTLMDISKRLLGSTKYVNRFYEANKGLDLEFTQLQVGTRLRVPKL